MSTIPADRTAIQIDGQWIDVLAIDISYLGETITDIEAICANGRVYDVGLHPIIRGAIYDLAMGQQWGTIAPPLNVPRFDWKWPERETIAPLTSRGTNRPKGAA